MSLPLICVGPGAMIGPEALEPEIMRSPVKVVHVRSKSASAWEWITKYGKAPFSSLSQGKGSVREGQSARTIEPRLEFSLLLHFRSEKRLSLLIARKERKNSMAKSLEDIRLLKGEGRV